MTMAAISKRLIKPLVIRIKCRDRDVKNAHFTNSAMPTAWLDQYRITLRYLMYRSIKLHLPFALNNIVNLGELFVVVRLSFFRNIYEMN